MSLLGGALPNVMFLIGILAIGLGLGIELKLLSLNKEIDKTGRIGAMLVGSMLVAGSLFIYLNPALTSPNQLAPVTANGALMVPPTVVTQTLPTAASLPPEALVAIEVPTAVPSAAASAVPPTQIPQVTIPDVHGLSEKEAQDVLSNIGLQSLKVDECNDSDQGDPKARKNRVLCQNPAANAAVPLGTTVEYVLR